MARQMPGARICALGAVILATLPTLHRAAAQDLDAILATLDASLRSRLVAERRIERFAARDNQLQLRPDHRLSGIVAEELADLDATILAEQLLLVEAEVDQHLFLRLYNSLRRVSELSYIEYYNERIDRWNELFYESRAVVSADDLRRLPDPVVRAIPPDDRVTVLQGLPPFGDIVSEYRYTASGRAFLFSGTNIDPLSYRGVRVVRPGDMKTYILVLAGDDAILMYGAGAVRAFTVFGLLDNRIEAAFSGRTDGLFDWYARTYLETLPDR